ncbi:MAG TPA: hypothetical protein ENK19_05700 [Acidobacteria bacterium]|nr:hypothetical protein [Acidobacteriota bacterium]
MTPLPLIARVECRSEARGEDRPVAVWIGGRRWAIGTLSHEHLEGPREAGGTVRHVAVATLEDGRRLRLERRLPEGPWRVLLLTPPELS